MWLLELLGIDRRKKKIPRKLRLKATMTYHCIKKDIEARERRNQAQKTKITITDLPEKTDKKNTPDSSINEERGR